MIKSFTELLTNQQIQDFFELFYPSPNYKHSFYLDDQTYWPHKEKYINAFIYSYKANFKWDVVLKSYESSIYNREWINYLYQIFGEEYKQAYIDHCLEIFYAIK